MTSAFAYLFLHLNVNDLSICCSVVVVFFVVVCLLVFQKPTHPKIKTKSSFLGFFNYV